MKYKKEDFPSLDSADGEKFGIKGTVLEYYDGQDETVFVPYGITEIGEGALRNKEYCYGEQVSEHGSEYLEEVIIPDTVKYIAAGAFDDCEDLWHIYIPESVTFIADGVFADLPSLRCLEVDENNPVYKMVDECLIDTATNTLICGFAGCKIPSDISAIAKSAFKRRAIVSIEIPEGIVKIEDYTFTGCDNLREVKLPSTLEEIGICAFSKCSSLTKITLPENVKWIGASAFAFSGIKEIELPAGLEYLGHNAFWYSALERITLAPLKEYGSGLFENCAKLDRVEFLDGWQKIPVCFFSQSGVKEVILPDSVEEIGNKAFAWCYSLSKINLPHNLKSIGDMAFYCCGLEEIDFPESLKTVEYCAFGWCSHLKHVTVPPGVVENASDVFWRCERLESAVIEEGTKKIAERSFSSCKKLKSVTFPDSLEQIDTYAFGECDKLKEVELPKKTKIADKSFYECGVEPIDEVALMDMSEEEYKRLMREQKKIKIKITRR